MKFGKLFTKLITNYPEFATLSANKCSDLTYKELRAIAKVLYYRDKDTLSRYFFKTKGDLAKMVYQALRNL